MGLRATRSTGPLCLSAQKRDERARPRQHDFVFFLLSCFFCFPPFYFSSKRRSNGACCFCFPVVPASGDRLVTDSFETVSGDR